MKRKPPITNDFAWHIHDELSSWTARVDTKASIALAIEAASLGFVVTLSSKDGLLAHVESWGTWTLHIGTIVLLAGVVLAVAVVLPQLRGRRTRAEHSRNFIYFGHLRHWDAEKLADRLEDDPVGREVLARQLVTMSKILWSKHVLLQWSLVAYVISVALVGSAFLAPSDTGSPSTKPPASHVTNSPPSSKESSP